MHDNFVQFKAQNTSALPLVKYLLLLFEDEFVSFILHCFNGFSFYQCLASGHARRSLFPVSPCLTDARFWHLNLSFSLLLACFFFLWRRSDWSK